MSLTLKTLRPAVDRLETGLVRAHVHRLSISKSRQSGWKDAPTFRFTEPLCIFRSVHLSKNIIWSHHTTSERRKCQKKGAKEKRERVKKGRSCPEHHHISLSTRFSSLASSTLELYASHLRARKRQRGSTPPSPSARPLVGARFVGARVRFRLRAAKKREKSKKITDRAETGRSHRW